MLHPVTGSHPFHGMARTLVEASPRHPALARDCRAIFQRDLSGPLADYLEAMMAQGAVRPEIGTFLAEHFIQMLFFTNAVVLAPQMAPARHDARALAERATRLFLQGCRSG